MKRKKQIGTVTDFLIDMVCNDGNYYLFCYHSEEEYENHIKTFGIDRIDNITMSDEDISKEGRTSLRKARQDAEQWGKALHRVNASLKKRIKKEQKVTSKKLPRILLTGSPIVFPNMKIPLLIEEIGGIVASDETCMGERGMWDPAVITDDSFDGMMRALANRALRPCPCPTFADNSQRLYRLKQLIKDNEIQGVIYHVLRGCLVYDFEYRRIEEELGKLGIPVIRLESDYNEEDVEQLRIRIEAFIELIKLRQAPEKRATVRKSF